MARVNETTKNSIQAMVLNFLTTISDTEDIQLSFNQNNDGQEVTIELKAKKKSKAPKKSVSLQNNVLVIDTCIN